MKNKMKNILGGVFICTSIIFVSSFRAFSQGATCAAATSVTLSSSTTMPGSCTPSTRYTAPASTFTTGAGYPNPTCDATANNDGEMWFKVTTSATATNVGFQTDEDGGGGSPDMDSVVVQVFSGSCGSLTQVACNRGSGNDQAVMSFNFSASGSTTYYIRIWSGNGATGVGTDGAAVRLCGWEYTPNPCIPNATVTSMPACGADITTDISWGTDADCDGSADVYSDWCFSSKINISGCTTASGDLTCTVGNSSSYWTTFEYNSSSLLDYGIMSGISVRGSGTSGNPVYGQVYDFTTGCPLGGCQQASGSKAVIDLTSMGLTNGTKYYLRLWAASGNAGSPSPMSGGDANCEMGNVYNDLYPNASNLCQHGPGTTVTVHNTSNGLTATNTKAAGDCAFAADGPWGEAKILSKCGAGKNINHNDNWFRYCVKGTNGTFNTTIDYKNCAGSTGIQFWMFADGTSGSNNQGLTSNDFCDVDGLIAEGDGDMTNPLLCESVGTVSDFNMSSSVTAGQCYYIVTDGFSGDYCDFDMIMTCTGGCIIAPTPQCLTENTAPTIWGGTSSVDTAGTVSTTEYDIVLSEPVFCCEINAADFTVTTTDATNYPVPCGGVPTLAQGVGCGSGSCGDTTRTIRVTLCSAPPAGYTNQWRIVPTAGNNLYDMCQNKLGTTDNAIIVVLPVELVDFRAVYMKNENKVAVKWQSASEDRIVSYILKRSPDAIHWHQAAVIPAKNQPATYIYDDYSYFFPTTYYQLWEINVKGETKRASHIISVKTSPLSQDLKLSYSPADKIVEIKISWTGEAEDIPVNLFNMQGQKIKSQVMRVEFGENSARFDLTEIPKGVYFLNIPRLNEVLKIPIY